MISMLWRFMGDTTPMMAAMARMAPEAEKAGKKIASRFNLGFASAASAIAIGAVTGAMSLVNDAFTTALNSARNASAWGTTIAEAELLERAAARAGVSVETMVRTLREGGAPARIIREHIEGVEKATGRTLGEGTIARLAFQQDRGDAAWNDLKRVVGAVWGGARHSLDIIGSTVIGVGEGLMNPTKFYDRIADRMSESIWGPEFTMEAKKLLHDEVELQKKRQLLADKEVASAQAKEAKERAKDLARARGENADIMRTLAGARPDADALTRVGVFTSRSGYEQRQFHQMSLQYLKQIAQNTRLLEKAAESMPEVET